MSGAPDGLQWTVLTLKCKFLREAQRADDPTAQAARPGKATRIP